MSETEEPNDEKKDSHSSASFELQADEHKDPQTQPEPLLFFVSEGKTR